MARSVYNWLIHNDQEDYYYLRRSSAKVYLIHHLGDKETIIGRFDKLTGSNRAIAVSLKANKVTLSGKDLTVKIIPDYYETTALK